MFCGSVYQHMCGAGCHVVSPSDGYREMGQRLSVSTAEHVTVGCD